MTSCAMMDKEVTKRYIKIYENAFERLLHSIGILTAFSLIFWSIYQESPIRGFLKNYVEFTNSNKKYNNVLSIKFKYVTHFSFFVQIL